MEKLKFICPHCSKKLSADSALAGRQIRCPACRSVFAVDAAQEHVTRLGLRERPKSLVTFGVLNIVFASLGLILSIMWTSVLLAATASYSARTGRSEFQAGLFTGLVIGVAILVWQLAAGIGLLNCKSWARRGLVVYGWIGTIVAGVMVVFGTLFFILAIADNDSAGIIMKGCLLAQGIGGLVFPVLMVVFLSKPHVVAACDREKGSAVVAKTRVLRPSASRPEEAERLYQEGKGHWKEYRSDQALQAFKKALAINPNHEGALYQVAFIHDRNNDPAKAMLGYQRLAFKYPDNPQYDRAVAELQQVVGDAMGPMATSLYGELMRPTWRAFVDGLPGKSDGSILNA